jgi:YVTN family beta-propeller protein
MLLGAVAAPLPAAASFVNFETGQVRPLALSADGTRLFAINTPDNRLEIFTVDAGTLSHSGSVPVGLEPIAVAVRNAGEVWVVNHLSDSLSIVDVATDPPRVVRTIQTCDEPRDIVFAGPGNDRAFVTAARRGQNCAPFAMADLTTGGIGRAIVQVYDATNLGNGLRGNPLANLVLFGDTPRALARSADGNTVYAAAFHSGNQTTALNEGWVCDGGAAAPPCIVAGGRLAPGGMPAPNTNFEGATGPENGLIVKFDPGDSRWEDNIGRDWSDVVRFTLPDLDVFAIDAAAPVPVETASFAHVGTVLFNMVVNPVSGRVYVSNTEARNEVRFEGPGIFGGTAATTVQGHLHESRVTVLDGANVVPRHLNKHIDYAVRPAPPGVKNHSLATPLGMAVSADGQTLYVTAFGSDKVGVFDTAALEGDTFVPNQADHIGVSGGGPTGLVIDDNADRLYVFTRFDNSISVIDVASRMEVAHVPVYSPEPAEVVAGRSLLYDAAFTSSNGEASCSSCHIFGDFDSLAWDLGNPDDEVIENPIPTRIPAVGGTFEDFHPLKGPMTTQSLRGMAEHGSMHWRGDRTGGNDPGGDPFDEDAAFKKFNVAFPGLIGREAELSAAEMQAFTDFILTVTYPPNPIRNLDQSLTNQQQLGHDLFFGRNTDVAFNCNGCHTLDAAQGFFGSDGFTTFEGETQMFKVPHLRNVYQKIGMFGRPQDAGTGPQVRGVGVLHDGSIDTVFRFLGASVFTLSNAEQRQLEQFMFAFDSNLAPVVGQQVTLTSTSNTGVIERADLLLARAALGECDIVVKGLIGGVARGAYRLPDGTFQLDREGDAPVAETDLRLLTATPGQELTYTCVPPGSGLRIGVDRDDDTYFDGDEIDLGTDPADPAEFPGSSAARIAVRTLKLRDDATVPIDPERRRLSFRSSGSSAAPSGVIVPAWDSTGDPSLGGARLILYRADGSEVVTIALPAAHWERAGSASRPGYRYRDRERVDGPITSITLRAGKLTMRGKGAGLYPLAGAPQDVMGLRLELGSGVELCTAAPAAVPAASNDTATKFSGERGAPAPAVCPRKPLG